MIDLMSIAAKRAFFSWFLCALICLDMPSRLQRYTPMQSSTTPKLYVSHTLCHFLNFARIVTHPMAISIAVLNGVLCGSLWRGDWLLPFSGGRCVKNTIVKTAGGGASSLQSFVVKLPLTATDPFQSLIVHSERGSCAEWW